jgi:phosphomevalonate kinase
MQSSSKNESGSGVTVILISGKRCAGKDTFAQVLKKYLEEKQNKFVHLTHFADECKRLFASQSGTDYQRLLNDREYKEQHRAELTNFYTKSKTDNVLMFCEGITGQLKAMDPHKQNVVIVSDLRHQFEVAYFKKFNQDHPDMIKQLVLVRIEANNSVKELRGWKLSAIDSDTTEIDLDQFTGWDLKCDNNAQGLDHLTNAIQSFFGN